MPEALVHTVADVAVLLGIGESTVYDRIADHTIRSVRIGRRIVIPKSEIQRILGEGEVASAKPGEPPGEQAVTRSIRADVGSAGPTEA